MMINLRPSLAEMSNSFFTAFPITLRRDSLRIPSKIESIVTGGSQRGEWKLQLKSQVNEWSDLIYCKKWYHPLIHNKKRFLHLINNSSPQRSTIVLLLILLFFFANKKNLWIIFGFFIYKFHSVWSGKCGTMWSFLRSTLICCAYPSIRFFFWDEEFPVFFSSCFKRCCNRLIYYKSRMHHAQPDVNVRGSNDATVLPFSEILENKERGPMLFSRQRSSSRSDSSAEMTEMSRPPVSQWSYRRKRKKKQFFPIFIFFIPTICGLGHVASVSSRRPFTESKCSGSHTPMTLVDDSRFPH